MSVNIFLYLGYGFMFLAAILDSLGFRKLAIYIGASVAPCFTLGFVVIAFDIDYFKEGYVNILGLISGLFIVCGFAASAILIWALFPIEEDE